MKISRVKRYRWEKLFWLAMVVPTVLWLGRSVLFVSLLSVWALILSAAAAQEAAEASEKADEARDDPA